MGPRKLSIIGSQRTCSGYSGWCRARCGRPWDRRGISNAQLSSSPRMVFSLPSLVAHSFVRGCRGSGVVRIGNSAMEDGGAGILELPHSSTRRLAGKSRPGRLSMANPVFHALLSGLRAELARTMGAECLAQFCHHDFAVADDVLSCVVAGILPIGDDLA